MFQMIAILDFELSNMNNTLSYLILLHFVFPDLP